MAQELGAGSVVEGSVRLDKQQVRIAVQLIDARNEQAIWAEQYDRELHDVFAVQSDVALRIADALQATLSPDERRRVEKPPTQNLPAYELYLKSQQLPINEREPNLQAIQMLHQALEADPKFAVAQARIAYRTMFLASYGDVRNLDVAIDMAHKAIGLDPTLAEGHVALASAYGQKGQVENARISFLRAMELNPNLGGSMNNLSIIELDVGRYDESLAWTRRAFRLAPNSVLSYYHVGVPLIWLGDDEISARWLAEADRRFPNTPRIINLMMVLKWLRGDRPGAVAGARALVEAVPRDEEALSLLAELTYLEGPEDAEVRAERSYRASPDITAAYNLVPESPRARYAYLLVKRGNRSGAPLLEEALAQAKKGLEAGNQSSRVPVEIAAIHATRQENQPALDWLQRGYDQGWRDYRTLARDPMFESLRRERRFEALLQRMAVDVAEMRERAQVREVLELPAVPSAQSAPR
jgi:tetratricopeptide (TPR) repeat protein